jgi:hypothetical protein
MVILRIKLANEFSAAAEAGMKLLAVREVPEDSPGATLRAMLRAVFVEDYNVVKHVFLQLICQPMNPYY